MHFVETYDRRADDIIRLFDETFTASEGPEEGRLIADLVRRMLSEVAPTDIHVSSAMSDDTLLGTVIFTRMSYTGEDRTVFILSPAAVATEEQGKGTGQALISHALSVLRQQGVDVVLTYGDPAFYSKVGFQGITESVAKAPLPLTYPDGWLAQSLTGKPLEPLQGAATCVAPLNDPALW